MFYVLLDPKKLVYIWLIIAMLFLFAEVGTPGLFVFIAFAVGALLTAGVAFLGYTFAFQCIFAISTSLIAFFVLRYFVSVKKQNRVGTNIDALAKRKGVVVKKIEPYKVGQVKVRGELWSAESEKPQELKVGMEVDIVKVKGNRLVVKS